MDNHGVAEELLKIAKLLTAMEFDTEAQLKKYLKEHPDADKSKHSVKKKDSKPKTDQGDDVKKKVKEKMKGEKSVSGLKKQEKGKKPKGWSTNPNWENTDVYEVGGEGLDDSIPSYRKVLEYLQKNDKGKAPTNGTEYVKGGRGMWKENKLQFKGGKWYVISKSGYSGG
jgi:hypothetical protein